MEKVVIIIASLAFAALVSCANSPDNEPATASQVISFIVDAEQLSRQPIEGADMPDDQQIVVGAWNTVSGDYFYNSTFTKNAADGTWQEVKIWPVNGITSFLSYTHRPRTPRNYIIPGDVSSAILVMDSKKLLGV